MREILHRGKGLYSDYWYKGYYVRLYDHKGNVSHRIYPGYAETDCGDFYPDWDEVDPETVGQFTGLTDKNGKKIFEGDIVTGLFSFGMEIKAVVVFQDGAFGLRWRRGGAEQFSAFTSICNVEFEAIGNVHDNPELLEEGSND